MDTWIAPLRRGLAAALVAALGCLLLAASAQASGLSGQPAGPEPLDPPAQPPAADGLATLNDHDCAATPDGERGACIEVATGGATDRPAAAADGVSPQAIVPVPEWCAAHNRQGIWGKRTEACEIYGIFYETFRVVDGVRTTTGLINLDVYNYTFSSTDLGTWAHQAQLSAYEGWGDALNVSLSGSASGTGACTTRSSDFPPQPVAPLRSLRGGDAFFDTTATTPDAVGHCATTWDVVFTNPGYPTGTWPVVMNQIRCDNAAGANGFRPARVGCVVPWYAAAAGYSASRYPTLASHVARAQASGLPGASFAAPLTRTTDLATRRTNRRLACGDAPSILGRSCDEYPLASSNQGLAAGGTRRTFEGCDISAPSGDGPTGASACMINRSENNAQGALMARFYYDQRVLNGDPFRVVVTP